jgi:hypothetical protein
MVGFYGWIFYLDADAYIYDPNFNLVHYLDGYSDKALIAAPGGNTGQRWDINSGVLLINLAHDMARQMIEHWHADIMQTSDEQLRGAQIMDLTVKADQYRLTRILRNNPEYLDATHLAQRSFLNDHKATFVRHVLGVRGGKKLSMAERMAIMREDIST